MGTTYDEGQGGDVREEDTGAERRRISDDDFNQEQDGGVSNLVYHSASNECVDIGARGLDNSAEDVEKDGYKDELYTAEDICNLGSGWLSLG
jgi:hypothetical protein